MIISEYVTTISGFEVKSESPGLISVQVPDYTYGTMLSFPMNKPIKTPFYLDDYRGKRVKITVELIEE